MVEGNTTFYLIEVIEKGKDYDVYHSPRYN